MADLTLLRASVQELQQQLSRVCEVRLASTILLLVFFVIGIFQARTNDVLLKVNEIQAFANAHGINQAPIDPLTLMLIRPLWIPKTTNASNLDGVLGALTRQTDQLSELYRQSFLVSASILGTTIKADVRLVVLVLPVFFSIFHLYVRLYRHKRDLVAHLAGVACEEDASASFVDRLLFTSSSHRNFYRDCSLRVTNSLYRVFLASLLATIAWFARGFVASGAATWPLTAFAIWSLTIILIFRMVAETLSRSLTAEFAQRFHVMVEQREPLHRWAVATGRISKRLQQFPGSLSRPIGALLILATLVLTTSVNTTGPTEDAAAPRGRWPSFSVIPQSGISVLAQRDYWLPSLLDGTDHLVPEDEPKWLHALGSLWYALAVALASLHLLVACRVFGWNLRRTYGWLSPLTITIFYQVILQFAAYLFLGATWPLIWVFLAVARIGRSWRRPPSRRSLWSVLAPHVAHLAIPVIVADVVGLLYVVVATQGDSHIRAVWGLPVYYLGVSMLAHSIYADQARHESGTT